MCAEITDGRVNRKNTGGAGQYITEKMKNRKEERCQEISESV